MKKFLMKIPVFFLLILVSKNLSADNETLPPQVWEKIKLVVLNNSELILKNEMKLLPYDTFNKQNVSLDVKSIGSSRSTENNYRTTWGSFDKSTSSSQSKQVTIRGGKKFTWSALEFFWVLRNQDDKSIILKRCDPKFFTKEGENQAEFSIETESSNTKYATIGIHNKSGEAVTGWVVRLIALFDGRVLGVKASSPSLEKLAKSGAVLAKEN